MTTPFFTGVTRVSFAHRAIAACVAILTMSTLLQSDSKRFGVLVRRAGIKLD